MTVLTEAHKRDVFATLHGMPRSQRRMIKLNVCRGNALNRADIEGAGAALADTVVLLREDEAEWTKGATSGKVIYSVSADSRSLVTLSYLQVGG